MKKIFFLCVLIFSQIIHAQSQSSERIQCDISLNNIKESFDVNLNKISNNYNDPTVLYNGEGLNYSLYKIGGQLGLRIRRSEPYLRIESTGTLKRLWWIREIATVSMVNNEDTLIMGCSYIEDFSDTNPI